MKFTTLYKKRFLDKFIFVLIFVLFTVFMFDLFSVKTYQFSSLEIDKQFYRQQYLGENLGVIYKNRFGVTFFTRIYPKITKLEIKFFSDLEKNYFYILLIASVTWLGINKNVKK